MKKFIKYCLPLMLLLLFPISALFAQGGDLEIPTVLTSIFATFGALVLAIPIVSHFILRVLGKTKATHNIIVQVVTWGIGIGLTMVGWFLGLGFLVELSFWWAVLYGAGASLAANGVADTKIIQGILLLFQKK
jgi:hypothetical protein